MLYSIKGVKNIFFKCSFGLTEQSFQVLERYGDSYEKRRFNHCKCSMRSGRNCRNTHICRIADLLWNFVWSRCYDNYYQCSNGCISVCRIGYACIISGKSKQAGFGELYRKSSTTDDTYAAVCEAGFCAESFVYVCL